MKNKKLKIRKQNEKKESKRLKLIKQRQVAENDKRGKNIEFKANKEFRKILKKMNKEENEILEKEISSSNEETLTEEDILKRNILILESLEKECNYEIEQRRIINQKLEEEGFFSLEEKVQELQKKVGNNIKKIEESPKQT